MCEVILCGRLTAEPNLTFSKNNPDMAIVKYSLAIEKGYGEKKKSMFVNCTAFGKAGEFVSKYFHKGQRVLVSGELDISNYEKDGEKNSYTQVVTTTHEFADGLKQGKVEKAEDVMSGFTDIDDTTDDGEVPF